MVDVPIEDDKDNPLVLVVDDEPMNIFVLEAMLKSKEVHCTTATNGQQALDII